MSTFIITITSPQTAQVSKDGNSSFRPRNMVPVINGDNITFQHPSSVDYDFTVATTDTITAEGNPITGTATEIADALLAAVFFVEAGGGGAALDEVNAWTAKQHFNEGIEIQKDVNSHFSAIIIENYDETSPSSAISAIGVYTWNNGLDIQVRNDDGTYIDSYGGKLNINTGGNIVRLQASISDYADDAAAAAASLPVGGLYRTGSILKIRVA
jgi:hypothetical protein